MQTSHNMISVCMALYNGEKYIYDQIKSILSQLNEGDELIISDDGSTDNTIQIIESFNTKQIILIRNKKRGEIYNNFENAIRYARNDFILLADQDDVWLENKLEMFRSNLCENDLVISNCRIIDGQGLIIKPLFFKYHSKFEESFIGNLYKNTYLGCCMGFRREILDIILPFPNGIANHDWWIGLICKFLNKKIKYISKPLLLYRRHETNSSFSGTSGNPFYKKIYWRIIILIKIIKRIYSISNEQLIYDIKRFVESVSYHNELVNNCLKTKSVESLPLRGKFRSLEINFFVVYSEILKLVSANTNKGNGVILDVCCGLGFFTELLGKIYSNVKGIDLNRQFLEFAVNNSYHNESEINYYIHDINDDLPNEEYLLINSIFGINTAKNPEQVVLNFIEKHPQYIVLFDGNSSSLYGFILKKIFRQQNVGINFSEIKKILKQNNYELYLEKNIHIIPTFLIDMKLIGPHFGMLNIFLRRFNMLSASKFIIAKNLNSRNISLYNTL